MMYFATCPRCFSQSCFDSCGVVTCPSCLRNFDPTEPLLPKSEKQASDAMSLDAIDQGEVEDFQVEPGDVLPGTDMDFEEGI